MSYLTGHSYQLSSQPDDNDLLHLHDDSDEVSIMSYEKVKVVNGDGEFDEEDEEEEDEDDEVQFVRYFD